MVADLVRADELGEAVGKHYAWVLAGAVLATAGVAHAQDNSAPTSAVADRNAVRAETPWYERFTTTHGVTETLTGSTENDRLPAPSWRLSDRWGVTVDVHQAQRIDRALDPASREDQTAVGAYYQFTPRVRLGGEVSVGVPQDSPALSQANHDDKTEPSAGVKLESAFRF